MVNDRSAMKRVRRSYDPLIERLRNRVLDGPGHLDAAVRIAAYSGEPVAEDLTNYVGKVRDHAFKVVEADVLEMRTAGRSDDEIFELTIATALGAGLSRLDTALQAMEQEK